MDRLHFESVIAHTKVIKEFLIKSVYVSKQHNKIIERKKSDRLKMSYLQEVGRMNIKEKKLENNS